MQQIIPIRAFKDNYIWMLFENSSNQVWVVDPGDAEPVIFHLKKNHLTLKGILLTHHHKDHSGGIEKLRDFAEGIPVYASNLSSINQVTHGLKNGETVPLGSKTFEAFAIPGHTLDHIAYYADPVLFCGDTLFSGGCGKIFEGTAKQMYTSLQKIFSLPNDTKIYCGHEYTLANLHFAEHVEPHNVYIKEKIAAVKFMLQQEGCTLPAILGEEKQFNPFLRCDQPDVIHAIEQQCGKKLNDPVEVFYYLREWKNNL